MKLACFIFKFYTLLSVWLSAFRIVLIYLKFIELQLTNALFPILVTELWMVMLGRLLYFFKSTIRFIIFYHHICPINRITAWPCRTSLNIKERAVQLLSNYISHYLHRAEQSRNPSKRKLRHNVAPIKNTLPQYNSVARCKIFTIKNFTILTYIALFCTIRDKNYCNFHHCFLLFQKLSANS